MFAGWKLDPHWRLYFELKRLAWKDRCMEAKRREIQLQALDEMANVLMTQAQIDAMQSNEPRH